MTRDKKERASQAHGRDNGVTASVIRLICEIQDDVLVVLVLEIGYRSSIYR